MTHAAENFSHPHHADWDAGREDGCTDNPYLRPGSRSGAALESYLAGFESGTDDQSAYLDEQDAVWFSFSGAGRPSECGIGANNNPAPLPRPHGRCG